MVDYFPGRTPEKEAERVLQQKDEYFRLLADNLRDYALILLDAEGLVLEWSSGAERILGYQTDEILGKYFAAFYTRQDMQEGKPQKLLEEAASKGRAEDEGWRLRKDGTRFWANVVITALRDELGRLRGYCKVVRDVTDRKQAEGALRNLNEKLEERVQERTSQLAQVNQELRTSFGQLRALAARLQAVREEERTSIAREIHDELGQGLTALKMDIVWIMQRLPSLEEGLRVKAESMLQLIDSTIVAVRRIAAELRPGMLDDLGLAAAIEWQAEEFQARMGVECRVQLPAESIVLDEAHSTALFRIFQETLTNVARHAAATCVTVKLERTAPGLVLEILDNGKGFDEAEVVKKKSLGLLGMKERALILGGVFEISGSPGKGTKVMVRIPWSPRGPREGVRARRDPSSHRR